MKKIDWLIHHVFNEIPRQYIINNHTHGMEKYNHMDFQMVLDITPKNVMYLLNTMGLRVQEGETFKAGDMVTGLYEDCSVRLDEFQETGRTVLRLIFPDGNNRFPEDPLCKAPYKYQLLKFSE